MIWIILAYCIICCIIAAFGVRSDPTMDEMEVGACIIFAPIIIPVMIMVGVVLFPAFFFFSFIGKLIKKGK